MLETITFGNDQKFFLQPIMMIGFGESGIDRIAKFVFSVSDLFFVSGIVKQIIEGKELTSPVLIKSKLPEHTSDQTGFSANTSHDVLFYENGQGFLNFFLLFCALEFISLSSMLNSNRYDFVCGKCEEHHIEIFLSKKKFI